MRVDPSNTFFCVEGKPVCLICNESVSVRKEFNLKRHATKHSTYEVLESQERKDKLESLRKAFSGQQNMFRYQNTDVEKAVRAC